MKVRHLRACASALAIGCALFSWEAALAAEDEVEQIQQNQADDDQEEDVITVVGSLIPTALEDAPKAVEVFTSQDLIEQGAPSMNEFLRNLTVNQSTGDLGEANPDLGAVGSGFNRVNLRGLGPNATLTLVNGRRLSSTNGGAGADINTVPTGLLGQVQVLRGGATTQYGAGAVAGAFNLVTRRDIDAPEIDFERTFYDGSNGAYKIDFRTGWVGDGGNLVLSLTHEEEDSMLATERDFSSLPFAVNPEGWNFTIGSNPGLFRVMSERASSFPFAVQDYTTLADAVNLNSGRVLDTLNPSADCATLGGFLVADEPFLAGEDLQEICAYPEAAVNDLVSELVRDQAYGEWNSQISPTLELHFDALYSKSQTTSLSEGSGSPTNRAVSESNLDGDPWLECGQGTIMFGPFVIPVGDPIGCRYFVPTEVAYYDADGSAIAGRTRNPFIDDFATRTGQVVYDGGGVFTTDEYTPFLFSGHPLYGGGLRRAVTQRERFLMNVGARGTFDSSGFLGRFLNGVNYNYNAQYNQYLQTTSAPRIIASRFNDALHGYGGPGCQAQDLVPTDQSSAGAFNATNGIQSDVAPGTQGCEFFNPFSSAFPTSVINGADNPNYGGAGFENSR
ncbi:MAG: TonB-dependent receptor plug domain-containing protein, partial [Maricaulaceae bacterium]